MSKRCCPRSSSSGVKDAGSLTVDIRDAGIARHDESVEVAVYFCCLEALQNTAKHAGPGATAIVRLDEDREAVHFSVVDDGVGFELDTVDDKSGLINLADRAAAAGGTLRIESAPGRGTRVVGRIPV